MHYNVCPEVFRKRLMVEGLYNEKIDSKKRVADFLLDLAKELGMDIINGPFVSSAQEKGARALHDGYEGAVIWAESGANIYVWARFSFLTVDIYTCKDFDTDQAIRFVKKYFSIDDFAYYELPDPMVLNYETKVEKKDVLDKGSGMFAKEFIPANTAVSYVDGPIMFAEKESLVPFFAKDHAVPFSKFFYRNGFNSLAVKFNHSCDPNCYFKDLFFVTTIKDIEQGEELTYSYSLICNNDWQNPEGKCFCGSKNCYGKIVPWRDLTKEDKIKFLPYTSDWILFEEMKKHGMVDDLKKVL